MANLSTEIVKFAQGDTSFYERFQDYYFHKSVVFYYCMLGAYDESVSLNEKSQKVSNAFFAEIEKVSCVKRTAENA